ncbi:hypothetical protein SmJEL517_g01323 [Synchytrium microbalum]|uniref:Major facilitator superfamily (MFS) profile domain-containing protein n=1 Tax=Synchytrium microbalum TaxID=1806994 RepID=A0A507CBS2_9FUNG|nr:uncharacterized protein SmJEL517_g01323 [Synchytrium microbalum]TPX36609.1 hypothetical protein SmJEL517_g01323 [Synchytrium microbalum]
MNQVADEKEPEQDGLVADWSSEEEKSIIRTIDWRMIPLALAMQTVAFLDQTNIGQARSYGLDPKTGIGRMERDLGMAPGEFNNISSMYYLVLLILEPISNFFLMRFKPSAWLSRIMISWGIVATASAVVTDYNALLACRTLLGIAEAGFFPGLVLALSYWYSPIELTNRISVIYITNGIVSLLAGLFAGLIFMLDAPDSPAWRWLFLIEGAPSIILGIFVIVLFPDGPDVAPWLSTRGKHIAINRLKLVDPAARHGRHFVWKDAVPVYAQFETWLHILALVFSFMPVMAMKLFLPSILASTFTGSNVQFASMGPALANIVFIIIGSVLATKLDDRSSVHIVCNLIGAFGYITLAFSRNGALSYGILFVISMAYPALIIGYGWMASIQQTATARGAILALAAGSTNIAGVVGSQIYRPSDAPSYTKGHLMVAGGLCASALCVLIVRISYTVRNGMAKARAAEKTSRGESLTDADKFAYPY